MSMDEIDRVCRETRELRFEAEENAVGNEDFDVRWPGGVWSMIEHGREIASAQAYAESDRAKDFQLP